MNSRLLVGPLLPERESLPFVSAADRERARDFSPGRRRGYFAWRALLGRELGCVPEIVYDATGAPALVGFEGFIGVSHSRRHAAVCLCEAPCAVDIESLDRPFARVIPRYMTASERRLSDDPMLPAAVWCAKECLYKYAGRKGLSLLEGLSVERVDFAAGRITGRVGTGEVLELSMRCIEGDLVVWLP